MWFWGGLIDQGGWWTHHWWTRRIQCGSQREEKKIILMKWLLDSCDNFKNKVTDLEQLAKDISTNKNKFEVLFIPKYQEGNEYSWGASKRTYRREPLNQKCSVANFLNLVSHCKDQIVVYMCRQFSKKARRYMLVYHEKSIHRNEDSTIASNWKIVSFDQNEARHKKSKSHQDANTIKLSFIEHVMQERIGL